MSARSDYADKVIAMRKRGLSPSHIGVELGLTRGQVSGVLNRAGLTKPMSGRRPKPQPAKPTALSVSEPATVHATPSLRRFSWERA